MHVVSASQLSTEELPPGSLQDTNQSLSTQLESVARAICKARRVAVVCGAGCSTSAGIPDFRSSTGLFKALKDKHPKAGLTSGKDLFNASLFQSEANTALYYSMIAELCAMSRDAQPTAFHTLLKALDDQGKLFRVYTQNIDALEAKAGLSFGLPPQQAGPSTAARGKKRKLGSEDPSAARSAPKTSFKASIPRCVPLHGSLQSLVCKKCSHSAPLDTQEYLELLADGQAVPCPSCETAEEVRSVSNFRSRGVGVMKPAVVLYGEPHADADLVGSVTASDLRGARPDLLLVVGTTLKVPGTQRLVSELAKVIHPSFTAQGETDDRPLEQQLSQPKTIFLNAEFPTQAKKWAGLFDVWVQSDIQEFSRILGDMQTRPKKSTSKKQPTLSLGINQVFSSSKAALPAPVGKPGAQTKPKPKAAGKSTAKKPAVKTPKPGWDMVLGQEYNIFASDPVVEGRRTKKPALDNIVNATLHVRPAIPPAESIAADSSQTGSRESSQVAESTVQSSPSECSMVQETSAETSRQQQQQTPSKPPTGRTSDASTLSSVSPSPSSSEATVNRSAEFFGVCSSPLSSAEKQRQGTAPRLDSPLKLLENVSSTKKLPPVPSQGRRNSQGLTEPGQYKVSQFFGAKGGKPVPAKA